MKRLFPLQPYVTFNIIRGLSLGVFAPIWVAYLHGQGRSLLELGLLGVIFEVTKLIFEVPAGGLADKRGEQWALTASALIGASAFVLFLLTKEFALAALLMMLWATSEAIVSGAYEAWVTKSVGSDDVAKTLMACTRLLVGAVVVGGISGGLLYLVWPGIPFLLAAMLMILNGFLVRQAQFPRHHDTPGVTPPSVWSIMLAGSRLLRAEISMLRVVAAGFFVSLAYDAVARFWQLELTIRGFSEVWFGVVFAGAGGIALLILSAGIRWHHVINQQPFLALAMVDLLGIGLCLCLVAGSEILALMAISLLLVMEDLRDPIVHSLLASRLDTEHKATVFSLYSGIGAAGEIVSGAVFGLIAQHFGLAVTFLAVGLCLLPAVGFLLRNLMIEAPPPTASIGEL